MSTPEAQKRGGATAGDRRPPLFGLTPLARWRRSRPAIMLNEACASNGLRRATRNRETPAFRWSSWLINRADVDNGSV